MKNLNNDIKTTCYVLRRTNYGEADRILNLITPAGKLAVLAKGVRKAKSKLAGGVEMFTKSEVVVHPGRGELGVLTGARMMRHCGNIVKDFARMELAGMMLRRVNSLAEEARIGETETGDAVGFFEIIDESLVALDAGMDLAMVEAWFLMNIARESGEEVNLYRDASGEKLVAEARYAWDAMERTLVRCETGGYGPYGAEEIKLMRLTVGARLAVVARVRGAEERWPNILQLARSVVK